MSMPPDILLDRMAVSHLQSSKPDVASLLSNIGLGKTENRETVHFCGLANVSGKGAVFFLPRNSNGDATANSGTAGLTMRALARFGREVESRKGVSRSNGDNATLAALIWDLAQDFRDNGIYSERTRYKSRNSGKPDWKKTLMRETPLLNRGGVAVYPETRTTRSRDSHETLLAQVQVAVMSEIVTAHSWWLDGIANRADELRPFRKPYSPRFLWAGALRSVLPSLYANRPTFLAKTLIEYLEETASHDVGKFICGVEDFSAVWEHMLRKTLPGVEEGWNAKLPKPGYIHKEGGKVDISERGMQTDIIVRDGNHLTVVDAKYYGATGKGSVPGWPDVVKQLYYQMALEKVVTKETVSNCFAFPSGRGVKQPYSGAGVFTLPNSPVKGFPEIRCRYFNIIEVMKAYRRNIKLHVKWPKTKVPADI